VRDTQTSRSPSIAPSDSISRIDSDGRTSRSGPSMYRHQPATRPSEYPVEVLWSLDDCRADPDVPISPANASRPPMERSIRHADGTMIVASEWAAIKATARMVKMDLLDLPPSRDRHAKNRTKSKIYFRTYFRKEWDAAVARMESLQPLLTLCASHWKAEHVLGNTLLVKVSTDSGEDMSDSAVEDNNKSPMKKRRGKGRSGERKRKKKNGSGPPSSEVDVALSSNVGGASNVETGGPLNGKAGGPLNGIVGGPLNGTAGGPLNGTAGGPLNGAAGGPLNSVAGGVTTNGAQSGEAGGVRPPIGKLLNREVYCPR
jgi:hypothetical protein